MTFSPASFNRRAELAAEEIDVAPATRVRVARATTQLARVVEFYRDGLECVEVERFDGHAGYTGVILALPGGVHLELTQHVSARDRPRPDADDLLVLYLPSAIHVARLRRRLERLGHACVQPVNPYWFDKGVTFEDPDHWRVVLCNRASV